MPGGYGKINGNDGRKTRFTSTNQPANPGRKPSIRKQLSELLLAAGEMIIESNDVKEIHDDGSITIKVPTELSLALKLSRIANGSKPGEALKAIQMIMEQIDGKPKQENETTIKGESVNTWLTAFRKTN